MKLGVAETISLFSYVSKTLNQSLTAADMFVMKQHFLSVRRLDM